jgi:hypothetical protein
MRQEVKNDVVDQVMLYVGSKVWYSVKTVVVDESWFRITSQVTNQVLNEMWCRVGRRR